MGGGFPLCNLAGDRILLWSTTLRTIRLRRNDNQQGVKGRLLLHYSVSTSDIVVDHGRKWFENYCSICYYSLAAITRMDPVIRLWKHTAIENGQALCMGKTPAKWSQFKNVGLQNNRTVRTHVHHVCFEGDAM
jgi:hypothetical protein